MPGFVSFQPCFSQPCGLGQVGSLITCAQFHYLQNGDHNYLFHRVDVAIK